MKELVRTLLDSGQELARISMIKFKVVLCLALLSGSSHLAADFEACKHSKLKMLLRHNPYPPQITRYCLLVTNNGDQYKHTVESGYLMFEASG